ncbi:MAG: type I glyceraldehyde-3-phosphate dehydrogenase [Candidatus Eisenbacteria bacterium]|nr:type I glyceraldehyde-3-phosphate dehydrogenase [Candidatus Eisenbacteria bacterium]
MAVKVGINGFGRIGRLLLRAGLQDKNLDFVAVNDLTDAKTLAHLFKYDSVHGPLGRDVQVDGTDIVVDGRRIKTFMEKDPTKLPWKDLGVDVAVESTGRFSDREKAAVHLAAGARKVLVSAPSKGADLTFVFGVNDKLYDKNKHTVVSIGSCTTNCLAPVARVLHDTCGIVRGMMTTVHAYTNDQVTQDGPHKDLRRARAASESMVPTSTGAAKAIGLVIPDLDGKFSGVAVRVPVIDGSLVDLTVEVSRPTDKEKINAAMKAAAEGPMKGILQYTEDPIVSVDIIGNPHSSIFDAQLTNVMGGNLVKLFSWYDNEWGFSCRMVDALKLIGA